MLLNVGIDCLCLYLTLMFGGLQVLPMNIILFVQHQKKK